jgi:glyoxylate reductase
MAEPHIVATRLPPGPVLDRLEAAGDVWVWPEDRAIDREVLLARAASAEALYCTLTDSIDVALLDAAPSLAVVSNMAVGVDNIDLPACTARRIPVGHTPNVLTETTADTAIGLLLTTARRFVEGVDFVRAGQWKEWDPHLLLGRDVYGTTLGIIGLGRIGRAIARRARGFDMKVLYTGRSRNVAAEADLNVEFRELEDLLGASDHVVVSIALTEQTYHLIDAAALAMMRPTTTLINISRGATVDSEALVVALRDGVIGAAGLDVTEPEPIPADHPLLALPNCVVLPHLGSSSQGTRFAMAMLAADNLVAGLRGDRIPACANPDVYAP